MLKAALKRAIKSKQIIFLEIYYALYFRPGDCSTVIAATNTK
jgi:hypothetical protein